MDGNKDILNIPFLSSPPNGPSFRTKHRPWVVNLKLQWRKSIHIPTGKNGGSGAPGKDRGRTHSWRAEDIQDTPSCDSDPIRWPIVIEVPINQNTRNLNRTLAERARYLIG
ncbi:hypothetical protein ZHAS_00014010 [Anopheles sinensis]|uniref:Uncharacterized protein n=1 Tax=Anopheles sinensis TaxID=74873 RepID=A0A084W744_ANOSI|nr:hypothetical protein ZHAS_00014010 [Anopheles sinensis]